MRKSGDISMLMVSSRIRLARNLEKIPFKTSEPGAFLDIAKTLASGSPDMIATQISDLSTEKAKALYEQHLISRELLSNRKNGILVTQKDNSKVAIMLGEEDHVRIQVIELGLNLKTAYEMAQKFSQQIASKHKVAFNSEYGYLTSCPSNLGTGMRASVMLFLPALTKTGQINNLIRMLRGERITVRGVYGEGSEALGYMYQISNQGCLGLSEQEIIEKVEEFAIKIATEELELQNRLFASDEDGTMDSIMRSLGVLSNAHLLPSSEAVELLSWLKLGDCLGVLKFKPRALDDLFFIIQPATLTTKNEQANDIRTRDKMRAKTIRDALHKNRMK